VSVLVKVTLSDFEAATLQRLVTSYLGREGGPLTREGSTTQAVNALQVVATKLAAAQRHYDDTKHCPKCFDEVSADGGMCARCV